MICKNCNKKWAGYPYSNGQCKDCNGILSSEEKEKLNACAEREQ
mgnify:CR=1 FL=1